MERHPSKSDDNRTENPLKNQGQNKGTTQEAADQANPTEIRRRAVDTVSGKGGDDEPAGRPAPRHPGQHGGVKAESAAEPDRTGVKRSGPSPADEPSSERTGTASDRSGGTTRSGKTDNDRNVG